MVGGLESAGNNLLRNGFACISNGVLNVLSSITSGVLDVSARITNTADSLLVQNDATLARVDKGAQQSTGSNGTYRS